MNDLLLPNPAKAILFITTVLLLVSSPGAAWAQNTIRGTVHAPHGKSIRGAIVIACFTVNDRCEYTAPHPSSRAVLIETSGANARYVFQDLRPGRYVILATRDINGNGREDAGDWVAQHGTVDSPRLVVPPATGIDLQMTLLPQPNTASPRPRDRSEPDRRQPRRESPGQTASRPGGGLSGIYIGVTRQAIAPGPGSRVAAGITWSPSRDWMTFFPDGRVFLGLPPRGLAGSFDWSRECPPHPSWCASYTVQGDRVIIRWATGETNTFTRRDGMLWTPDRLNYQPLEALNGLRLNGTYVVPWKEEFLPTRITFTRSGEFSEERLLSGVNWNDRDYSEQAREIREMPGGSGRYDIRENTLLLRYRDGREVHINIYVFPEELARSQPEEIFINAHDFVRLR